MTRSILCATTLRKLDAKLLALLAELRTEDWDAPTSVRGWAVRDIVAHLLDTALRRLAVARDGCFVETPEIRSAEDLGALVNRWNAEGVQVYRRLSPRLLREMMALAVEELADYFASLDPMAPAAFAVSWAGERESANWFDIARELTERWHHQQQIREAVGRPGILTPEFHRPVIDCFARGIPFALRGVEAEPGARIRFEVSGESGGAWNYVLEVTASKLEDEAAETWDARVVMGEDFAWKVFTKGIGKQEAMKRSLLEGNATLCEAVFGLTAIVG